MFKSSCSTEAATYILAVLLKSEILAKVVVCSADAVFCEGGEQRTADDKQNRAKRTFEEMKRYLPGRCSGIRASRNIVTMVTIVTCQWAGPVRQQGNKCSAVGPNQTVITGHLGQNQSKDSRTPLKWAGLRETSGSEVLTRIQLNKQQQDEGESVVPNILVSLLTSDEVKQTQRLVLDPFWT